MRPFLLKYIWVLLFYHKSLIKSIFSRRFIVDISGFTKLLHEELIKIGIPKPSADRYIQSMMSNIATANISDMTEEDVARFAKFCKAQLEKKKADTAAPFTNDPAPESNEVLTEAPTVAVETDDASDETADDDDDEIIIEDVILDEADISDVADKSDEEILTYAPAVDMEYAEPPTPPHAPKKTVSKKPSPSVERVSAHQDNVILTKVPARKRTSMFILITAVSSPLWLLAALILFVPFALLFAVESAIVATLVCLLAAFAALGTAASLTGIVYGIIQTFSVPSVGLYEIGFGIIVGGVTLILGILIYNAAVRFMPWLFKKTGALLKFILFKLKPLLIKYKRRCESL